MTDMVNHPPHYKSSDLEAIDVLEAFFPDDPLGWQVGKYILRYRKKNGLEDLKKAQWYLNRLIGKFEGGADAVPTDEREVPTDELVWTARCDACGEVDIPPDGDKSDPNLLVNPSFGGSTFKMQDPNA